MVEIPFTRPVQVGGEIDQIQSVLASGKWSGNGHYTAKCQEFLPARVGPRKTLLTTSCTSALEMSALLADIKPGDEVIMPSFTFV